MNIHNQCSLNLTKLGVQSPDSTCIFSIRSIICFDFYSLQCIKSAGLQFKFRLNLNKAPTIIMDWRECIFFLGEEEYVIVWSGLRCWLLEWASSCGKPNSVCFFSAPTLYFFCTSGPILFSFDIWTNYFCSCYVQQYVYEVEVPYCPFARPTLI